MHFSKDFTWGVATSSYQIEGAWIEAGKGLSIWDAFCQIPGKIKNNENGNVACDHYHRYKEDIQLMKAMGVKAYRFSISWPRIVPDGKGEINPGGIDFYNRIIDELIEQNIEPWITLYHWDLPQTLQVEDNGWLGKRITDHFGAYARVCFQAFGDRVVNWITINEAWVVSILGYGQGVFAPGGTSNSDPYLAGHHLLIAHAKAVAIYRTEFQPTQKGRIGMTNNGDWREPINRDPANIAAAERALEFFLAWFTDPLYLGKYPDTMVERLGSRLPKFTKEEIDLVHGSSDFLGLNHYTTMYAADASDGLVVGSVYGNGGISEDQDVNLSVDDQWNMTNMGWAVVPWGCHHLLHWISNRYNHPEIVMTENGCAYEDVCIDGKVDDPERIEFYRSYLEACSQAIDEGVHLSAYFAWSFMDNFEWASGFSKRFGLHYVNFDTLERTPKSSAKWFANMIKKHNEKQYQ